MNIGSSHEIDSKDLRDFLKSNDQNGDYIPLINPKKELTKGGRIVWVENNLTDDFSPMIIKNRNKNDKSSLLSPHHDIANQFKQNQNEQMDAMNDDELEIVKLIYDKANNEYEMDTFLQLSMQQTISRFYFIYFLLQGLLAGFSFYTFYLQVNAMNDEFFLIAYQPSAGETRRLFYLLSTISLVGSLHIFQDIWLNFMSTPSSSSSSSSSGSSDSLLVSSIFSIIFFIVVFTVSLIMSATDARIHLYDGFPITTSDSVSWTTSALADSTFNLKSWKVLSVVRWISALLAWICAGQIYLHNIQRMSQQERSIDRYQRKLSLWKSRVAALEGHSYSHPFASTSQQQQQSLALTAEELERLLSIQKASVQRTERQLEVIRTNRAAFEAVAAASKEN